MGLGSYSVPVVSPDSWELGGVDRTAENFGDFVVPPDFLWLHRSALGYFQHVPAVCE